MLGLEIPRRSQAVNLGWLLLVLGLWLTEFRCCLVEDLGSSAWAKTRHLYRKAVWVGL